MYYFKEQLSEGLKEEFNLDEQTQNELKRILVLPTIYPCQKKYQKVTNANMLATSSDHQKVEFEFEESVELGKLLARFSSIILFHIYNYAFVFKLECERQNEEIVINEIDPISIDFSYDSNDELTEFAFKVNYIYIYIYIFFFYLYAI
jgi:hypothetical protein